jgi:ABC-2 type transport system permease protein
MSKIALIAWKDYKTYFTSPVGYLIIGFFLFVTGFMFFNSVHWFIQQNATYQFQMGGGVSITDGILRPLFGNVNVFFLFVVPLITMRLFSEERKLHTLELLMTSPVTLWEMVLGKFFAAFLLVCTILLITSVYPIILFATANPDPGVILTTYLGTLLQVSCIIAIGVFFSSVTENQIIAGVLSILTGLFFWLIMWASQFAGPVFGSLLEHLSLINHFNNLSRGLLDTTNIVFYLSFIFMWLFLAHRALDSYRWR